MNNLNKKIILLCIFCIYIGRIYSADNVNFESQINQFITNKWSDEIVEGENLIIEVKPVWKQSKFQKCSDSLLMESHKNKFIGSLSLKIQCKSGNWSMYVPVYVGMLKDVVVLKNNVERGVEISQNDLIYKKVDIGRLTKGYFTNFEQLVEKESVRHLIAGHVLNPLMVDDVDLVQKGDSVQIVVVKGQLRVQMPGIALASGERGKQISVRNRSSNRIVKAVIKEKGLVEIII